MFFAPFLKGGGLIGGELHNLPRASQKDVITLVIPGPRVGSGSWGREFYNELSALSPMTPRPLKLHVPLVRCSDGGGIG